MRVGIPRAARRASLAVVLVGLTGLLVVALTRIPWDLLPDTRTLPPVSAGDVLPAGLLQRAEHFSEVRRWIGVGSLGVSTLLALVLGLTRWGARMVGALRGWWWLRVAQGVVVLVLLGRLLTLPFALAARHQSLDAGLSDQRLGSWIQDQAVAVLVAAVTVGVPALVLIGLARAAPRTWPVWGGLAAAALVVLGSYAYPVAVEPLSNSFTSLPAGPLRAGVLRLADREGVAVDDVLVADASRRTTTLNAYVTGFGSTRRVVLWDNTIEDLPRDQVLSIVAHELGHVRADDVLTGTVMGAFGAMLGVGLLGLLIGTDRSWCVRRSGAAGAGDPRAVALVLALIAAGQLVATPVTDTVSRAIEARADDTALRATRDPASFIALQRQLAARALQDPTPPTAYQLIFGTHPTPAQRIGAARLTGVRGGR